MDMFVKENLSNILKNRFTLAENETTVMNTRGLLALPDTNDKYFFNTKYSILSSEKMRIHMSCLSEIFGKLN